MNLIIFGPQGSGKGTQAELLAKKYNLSHLETGRIFRDISREDSEIGKKVFDTISVRKELITDELTVDVIKHYLEKVPADTGVIIDSAPRTVGQIEPVERMLADLNRSIDKAIYIAVPYEVSMERITKRYTCTDCQGNFVLGKNIQNAQDPCLNCGGKISQREDDTPDGVAKRLKTFYEITVPVIEKYREKGLLVEIDGNQSVEKVFEKITQALNN